MSIDLRAAIDAAEVHVDSWDWRVAAAVEAAAPLIEAAVREQVAREIRDKTPDGRRAQAFCAGMDRAARIARGNA